jgi:lipopolysaccharide export system permease protein
VLNLEPEDMSASELWGYSLYLDENELDSDSFWLAFWVKAFTPLTSVGMLMISVPLALTSSSRSGGAGQRIMIGVLIGVAFYVLNRVVNQMGIIYGVPPILSAGLPSILVIVISMTLIRRLR